MMIVSWKKDWVKYNYFYSKKLLNAVKSLALSNELRLLTISVLSTKLLLHL